MTIIRKEVDIALVVVILEQKERLERHVLPSYLDPNRGVFPHQEHTAFELVRGKLGHGFSFSLFFSDMLLMSSAENRRMVIKQRGIASLFRSRSFSQSILSLVKNGRHRALVQCTVQTSECTRLHEVWFPLGGPCGAVGKAESAVPS